VGLEERKDQEKVGDGIGALTKLVKKDVHVV
jgi:hypothetical protein